MFMKFDGHKMRNGVKVCATSEHRIHNFNFEPRYINFHPGYEVKVGPLALNDFRNMFTYY